MFYIIIIFQIFEISLHFYLSFSVVTASGHVVVPQCEFDADVNIASLMKVLSVSGIHCLLTHLLINCGITPSFTLWFPVFLCMSQLLCCLSLIITTGATWWWELSTFPHSKMDKSWLDWGLLEFVESACSLLLQALYSSPLYVSWPYLPLTSQHWLGTKWVKKKLDK